MYKERMPKGYKAHEHRLGPSWLLLSNFWHCTANSKWHRAVSGTGQAVEERPFPAPGPGSLVWMPVLPGGSGASCAREMTATQSPCYFRKLTLLTQDMHSFLTPTAVLSYARALRPSSKGELQLWWACKNEHVSPVTRSPDLGTCKLVSSVVTSLGALPWAVVMAT